MSGDSEEDLSDLSFEGMHEGLGEDEDEFDELDEHLVRIASLQADSGVESAPVAQLSLDDVPYDRDVRWINVAGGSRPIAKGKSRLRVAQRPGDRSEQKGELVLVDSTPPKKDRRRRQNKDGSSARKKDASAGGGGEVTEKEGRRRGPRRGEKDKRKKEIVPGETKIMKRAEPSMGTVPPQMQARPRGRGGIQDAGAYAGAKGVAGFMTSFQGHAITAETTASLPSVFDLMTETPKLRADAPVFTPSFLMGSAVPAASSAPK